MSKLSKSPEKGSFHKNIRLKALEETNTDPETDDYLSQLLARDQRKIELENDPEWQKHNLEYDLRSTDWIVEKAKQSDTYSQNLYAALCNNEFIEPENTWDILKEEYWSCSWRYAGGIVADILETGDYIDWYCSGIRGDGPDQSGYVGEGFITAEIKADLKKMGWVAIPRKDDGYL
jgi:hypothetical protein